MIAIQTPNTKSELFSFQETVIKLTGIRIKRSETRILFLFYEFYEIIILYVFFVFKTIL